MEAFLLLSGRRHGYRRKKADGGWVFGVVVVNPETNGCLRFGWEQFVFLDCERFGEFVAMYQLLGPMTSPNSFLSHQSTKLIPYQQFKTP